MNEASPKDHDVVWDKGSAGDGGTRVNIDDFLDALLEGVYVVDRDRKIRRWNSGAVSLTGFNCEEVQNRCCSDNILVHVDENGTELCKYGCPLLETMSDGEVREARVFLRHKNGYRVPVQIRTSAIRNGDGIIVGAVEGFREITDTDGLQARMRELEQAVFVDTLTRIPNRRYMEEQIERMIGDLQSASTSATVCLLDLDRFKLINDMYGHQIGDNVLRTVARTLDNCLRSSDIVGRWGGDEFLLLLPRTGKATAASIIERCRVLVEHSATPWKEGEIRATVSMGATVLTPGDNASKILARADAQLYKAKHAGRNRWELNSNGH